MLGLGFLMRLFIRSKESLDFTRHAPLVSHLYKMKIKILGRQCGSNKVRLRESHSVSVVL